MCGEDISERDILPRIFLRGGAVSSFCPLGRAVFPDNFLYLCKWITGISLFATRTWRSLK